MIVVDTSVAIKWAVTEIGSDEALLLLGQDLQAPDLMAAEYANALRTKSLRGEFMPAQAPAALKVLTRAIMRFEPNAPLAERAFRMAVELDHPVYDCFYLALAERDNSYCITADSKFVRSCEASSYANLVRAL